ncbi:carbohydrate ABC transporter permease [uncultured Robinsoniella sp.]|uniref:carbohydrate ABC transporter permease n=1 Tax=uncultured Robinsoniella sp. TaxID=904190 RepID=UPI00374F11C9
MFRKKTILSVLKYIFIYMIALLIILPILYMFLSSFKNPGEVNKMVSLPSGFYLENYKSVFQNDTAVRSFANSGIISVFTIGIDIFLCALASYAMARRKEKYFSFLYLLFLSAMMIPVVANLPSIYSIILKFGLKDTKTALVLIYAATQIPMGILLFTGFIKGIPKELDEAAIIDGCGYLQRFFKVLFPLMKPVMVTYALTTLVYVWNDFLMPLMVISSEKKKPITLAVYSFVNEHQTNFGAIYAMLVVAVVPPILLFVLLQKQFYQGGAAGAVKG